MAQKIFILSGKVSSRVCGESSVTPRAFAMKASAEEAAIDAFIDWLIDEDAIDEDMVQVARLEPEGTFDELSVKEMPLDSDGNISERELRNYLIKERKTNFFASMGTETYIDLDVTEAEIEED